MKGCLVLLKPVLYLSPYFKQHRQTDYDHLQAVRDAGDWETWIQFFLRGVIEVSHQATDTARKILQLREDHRQFITENLGRLARNRAGRGWAENRRAALGMQVRLTKAGCW
jgi:Fic family protein